MWILTIEYNEYDQFGEYFVAAFKEKPTFNQLKKLLKERKKVIENLLLGGGRIDEEYQWYHLRQVEDGKLYHDLKAGCL